MALTSRDETDLLLPLFRDAGSDTPFGTFLERLRRRTGAVHAGLLIRMHPGGVDHEVIVGRNLREMADAVSPGGLHVIAQTQQEALRQGRVYSSAEFNAHDPALKAAHARAMRQLGIWDDRMVRVLDGDPASAWLQIASEHSCSAADSALLSALVPYLAHAVRLFVDAERANLTHALNAAGLTKAGIGWMAFDRDGRIQDMAPATTQALQHMFGRAPALGFRPRVFGAMIERELSRAADHFANMPGAAPQALVLAENPKLDAILSGVDHHDVRGVVMVARCRHPRTGSPMRAEHFARLHALPRREAELAILLAEGRSLTEAGAALGLTVETSRNYSKRLFAKLGLRGQAELVRAVYESCALLA